jgi:uncharacterized membrane protein YccC
MSRMFEYHSAADRILTVLVALLIGMFVLVVFIHPG